MQDGTYLVKNDGSIVNYGERWAYGYFVANGRRGVSITPLEVEMLKIDAESLIVTMASRDESLIGVWTNPRTGTVYIDPVEHVSDRDSAIALGIQNGEMAIWDAREDKEITLH